MVYTILKNWNRKCLNNSSGLIWRCSSQVQPSHENTQLNNLGMILWRFSVHDCISLTVAAESCKTRVCLKVQPTSQSWLSSVRQLQISWMQTRQQSNDRSTNMTCRHERETPTQATQQQLIFIMVTVTYSTCSTGSHSLWQLRWCLCCN